MKIAVLAVQGAFIEHEQMLYGLGVDTLELRCARDLDEDYQGLILPGGESTAQGRIIRELKMLEPLRERINGGLPVLATCAGLILLAQRISGGEPAHLATLPVCVRRNAYGRQLGSFSTEADLSGVAGFPLRFIRAPYVESVDPGVEILARVRDRIVAVRYGRQLALSFHPELTTDSRLHQLFLEQIRPNE